MGSAARSGILRRVPVAAYVYLLRCADGTLYCGWTVDLRVRLAAHGDGRASRYTRSRRPVELVWSAAQPDCAAARREEARIKRLPRSAKLALVAGHEAADEGPAGLERGADGPAPEPGGVRPRRAREVRSGRGAGAAGEARPPRASRS
jgi:putative endonuclease